MIDPIELNALADNELTQEREDALRRELSSSPASQAELEAILTVKRILAEKTVTVEYRAAWRECVTRLNEVDRTQKVERLISGRRAWGLAGGLFTMIILAGLVNHGPDNASVHSADLARLVTSLKPSNSSQGDSVLNARLDRLLAQAKEWVVGDRLSILSTAHGELDGHPVIRITMRDASGDLAFMVTPDVLKVEGVGEIQQDHSFRLGHIGPLNCVTWTDGGFTLFLVADRGYEDLVTTASRFKVQAG